VISTLIRCYPGDRSLAFFLAVTLGVALASGAAWLISRRLAGKAALRHLVLFSALIGCLASPAAAWLCAATGLTLVSFPILRGEQGRTAPAAAQRETDPVWVPPRPSTDPQAVAAGPPLPHTNPAIDQSADVAAGPAANESPATPTPSAPDVQRTGSPAGTLVPFRGIATGVMFVWAAGAVLLLARLARDGGRVVRLRRSSRPLRNEAHQLLLREIAAKLGMRQVPLLLVSSRTAAPLAVGFGRPAVILPERLLGAVSDDELRDVLVHEAAHLQRGDQRVVLLQALAGALYWPIVSVHALNRELRRAREELCDNIVLAGRDAISYGKTLLHVAELVLQARRMGAAVGMIGGPGKLERRIAGLIDPRRNTMTTTGRKAACVVMFTFIALGAIASATRFADSAGAASAPTEIAAQAASPTRKPPSARDPEDPKHAGHFNGRVTGPDGKPLGGARVFIVPAHGANKEAGPVRARTGADGRFAFDAPDMTYTEVDGLPARQEGLLMVTAEGYAPDWFHTWGQDHAGLYRHWDPVKGAAVNMQLAKDDVPIRGRFLDPAGRPLVGARVRLDRLMIPLQRDLGAHLDRQKKGGLLTMTDYERSLYRPQILGLTAETRTDAEGRFTLTGLGRDRLAQLRISAPSVVDTTLTVMTRDGPDIGTAPLPNGKPTRVIYGAGFTLQLRPGRAIKGRVIDRDTREPVPGMRVGPLQHVVNQFSSSLYPWVTDEKGRFTITGLDPRALEPEIILVKDSPQQNPYRLIVAVGPPGLPYQTAWALAKGNADVLIECRRGIPFRLKLVDEQGRPVEAEVTYLDVQQNGDVVHDEVIWPVSWAARQADETYQGYVLPGPGAVLVRTPYRSGYRPACVDPKAYFAPGRTKWTAEEQIIAYGTRDTLTTSWGRSLQTTYRGPAVSQRDYTAIVLVNPPPNSGPLRLSATVVRDRPRRVSLVDPNGKPVVGAEMQESIPWPAFTPGTLKPALTRAQTLHTTLRAASFPLTGLHPDRVRRITFIKEDRQLIGYLLARGDGETAYTVRMEPWGTVTGRIVGGKGKALPIGRPGSDWQNPPTVSISDVDGEAEVGDRTDARGRFRIGGLFPGRHYSVKVYRGWGFSPETVIKNLVLRAGEVRDLGDIRINPSVDAISGTRPKS
jgi:beta-lactamase regulating signal transducer with metallopeptidase domain